MTIQNHLMCTGYAGDATASSTGELFPPVEDVNSEGVILSYCLTHGPLPKLRSEHFYADAHHRIYEAIQQVGGDAVAVAWHLRRDDRLKQVGGTPYLAMLIDCQPATVYPDRIAERLIELYRRRVLIAAARKIMAELYGELESGAAWKRFKQVCEEMISAERDEPASSV